MKKRVSFTEKNKNRKPLGELLPVRMPLGICIEPTNLCNFMCIQCAVSLPTFKKIVGKQGHIEMGLYTKIVADIKKMGRLNNLNLYGDGEPFLNPNMIEMVKIAKTNDIAKAITITTNGFLITEKLAYDIVNSGLDYIRVSIYSVYNENFKSITQTKYDAERVFNNIRTLRKIRDKSGKLSPFIYVKMIDTYSEENQVFKNKYEDVADEVNIETPMNWNGFNNYDLISRIDPKNNTDETTLQGYHCQRNSSGLKKICTTPFLSLNIKRNGDVCICIVDWNKGTKVGNMVKESLSEIWFGDNLRNFREMHIRGLRKNNESCKNCCFLYSNPDNMDAFSIEKYREILDFGRGE